MSEVGFNVVQSNATMERSLAEIEREVFENTRHLERLRTGMLRRSETPVRADGASVPRRTHPMEGYPQPPSPAPNPGTNLLPQPAVKLPRYNGLTPLEPYIAQVNLAALHAGWSPGETATRLALALEGTALQVLLDLSPEEQAELPSLIAALDRRFGQRTSAEQSREELANRRRHEGESLGAFAADLRLYVRRGYPTFPATARSELSLHAFLRGLAPERLQQHVRLLAPCNIDEALREAERAEEVLGPRPARALPPRPYIRAAEPGMGEGMAEEAETSSAQPAREPRRRPLHDRCYRCGEPGHLARVCPAPSPRLAGNDQGVRH